MVAIPMLLLVVAGCQRPSSPQPPELPQGPPPAPETTPGGKVITTPEDHSLTAAEYLKLGVPATDRPWSGDDMQRAATTLSSIAKADPTHLPRYRSERSGLVFARLTDPRNLDMYRTHSLSHDIRMSSTLAFLTAGNDVLQSYLAAFLKNQTGDSELVDLIGLELRTFVVVLGLVDEEVPTIKTDDPAYAKRMAGLERMRNGLATTVGGALTTLTERESFRTSERARLVGYMKETFPVIVAHLSLAAQVEAINRLDAMTKDDSLRPLQPALGELAAAVKSPQN